MKARENPFSSYHLHRIPFIPVGITWLEIIAKLESLHYRAAVTGPEGSGKTTFLFALESYLRENNYRTYYLQVYADPKANRRSVQDMLRSLMNDCIYFIDGADLLSPLLWYRLYLGTKPVKGLIITSHKKNMLPVLLRCRTNISLLNEIIQRLLGDKDEGVLALSQRLFYEEDGNIRHVLRGLYEIFSDRTRFNVVPPGDPSH